MLNALTTKAYIKATEAFRSFKNNQAGVTAIEYGLIAIAVAVLIVAVFYNDGGFIDVLKKKFNSDLVSRISNAASGL
ncbi:fimbrial protein [Aggregatibacter aphrophilus]|uniref:Flp family type IVb pilin n=1 Tax=Aggregatibacter aphrophilus TaxID=732 RepID=UPI0006804A18|nr:Flp family type IVb pilin [Aggregatibacter aphrophilus]AKU63234.1 fimbrial protein [Aggregatibacter aphrophilus]